MVADRRDPPPPKTKWTFEMRNMPTADWQTSAKHWDLDGAVKEAAEYLRVCALNGWIVEVRLKEIDG